MAAPPRSPVASPRLPSPPPIAEDQTVPKSPVSAGQSEIETQNHTPEKVAENASRRIRPGTKSIDMLEGPPVVDISKIDSPYQLSEYLRALYNEAIHPKDSTSQVPITRSTALMLSKPPKDIDRDLWLYELCRFLCQKVNGIIVALFSDDPPCSAQTCSEMRASEWQYLCAVHDPPKACCAIDYCCHTLDSAANSLTSQKLFPSRMSLAPEPGVSSHVPLKQLTNIFRRVYRIFAHAWFQHREVFWRVESRTGTYIFFKTVSEFYGLIPEDNYTLPLEAEEKEKSVTAEKGKDNDKEREREKNNGKEKEKETEVSKPLVILSRATGESTAKAEEMPQLIDTSKHLSVEEDLNGDHKGVKTAKRHRQTPSADLGAILTVLEEKEEDDGTSKTEHVVTAIHESQIAAEKERADLALEQQIPHQWSNDYEAPNLDSSEDTTTIAQHDIQLISELQSPQDDKETEKETESEIGKESEKDDEKENAKENEKDGKSIPEVGDLQDSEIEKVEVIEIEPAVKA